MRKEWTMSQLALKLGSYLKRTSHLADFIIGIIKSRKTFIKFLLVGSINTLIGMGMMFLLKLILGWPYWIATFSGNLIGAAVSFLLNRSFTFNSKVTMGKGIARFAAVIFICYVISFSAGRMIASIIMTNEKMITADSLAIFIGSVIYTLLNYLGQKKLVFNS
jgi:putative flippase GtrA